MRVYRDSGGNSGSMRRGWCYRTTHPLGLPVDQDMRLGPQTEWEVMAGEYATSGLYPDGHLMEKLRSSLGQGVLPADEVEHLDDGVEVSVAGLVIRRRRPLAKAVLMTLEDDTGHAPVVVWPRSTRDTSKCYGSQLSRCKGLFRGERGL